MIETVNFLSEQKTTPNEPKTSLVAGVALIGSELMGETSPDWVEGEEKRGLLAYTSASSLISSGVGGGSCRQDRPRSGGGVVPSDGGKRDKVEAGSVCMGV